MPATLNTTLRMTRKHVSPPGHWSWRIPVTHRHGTRHDRLMFVGGQSDLDAAGNVNNPGDLLRQADACMKHVRAVVESLDGRMEDVAKLNVFHTGATLADEDELLRRIRAHVAGDIPPVISLVRVPRLSYPGMAVVIDAVAIDNADGTMPRRASTPANHWRFPKGGEFSQGLRCGELLFVSAQSARDAKGATLHPGDIGSQAQDTIDNIARVLEGMGADLDDVVKLNTWFVGFGTDEDWRRAARVRSEAFRYPGPGATGVPVPEPYPDGALIRQDCWAMRGVDGRVLPRSLSWPKGHWDWPMRVTFQQGVKVGNLVFLGGQYACDVKGLAQKPGEREAQTRITMDFIRDILAGFGATMDDLVMTKCFYLGDGTPESLHANLAIRSSYFSDPAAATTNVALKTMGLEGLMLEIEGIAVLDR
ncbi:MAG TPA: RidA family protein [Usitatibacter sp.]|nr:RidA family protein [Usitatibacter sp.]